MSPHAPYKVLLVDDERKVVRALARALGDLFAVFTADGGAEGLEIVRNGGPFAVAVSDMRMPGMDGLAFVRRLRDCDPAVVPLLLTGSAEDAIVAGLARGEGVFQILRKPCRSEVVRAAIDRAVIEHEARRRAQSRPAPEG